MTPQTTHNAGFSLLELMVTVAIVGVLSSIAIPRYLNYKEKVYAANCLLLRRDIETQTQSYYFEHEAFTPDFIDSYQCPRGGVYTWSSSSIEVPEYGQVQCSLHHTSASQVQSDIPAGENLLDNSTFDSVNRNVKRWAPVPTGRINGWESNTGAIEIWRDGFLGYSSPNGGHIVELDGGRANDTISQSVQTEAGRVYEIKITARARRANSSDFSVGWGGDEVETFTPPTNEWKEYTVQVTGTGDPIDLSLSEIAGQSNGLGTLIDKVEVIATDTFE
ncbi:type IV pilin protein [Desulfoluna butyratoxydans]|uniref:Prokaryotic n-terminal methylation site n=1 Tax=Desulfoluna butyratoxydans TaxID=231438 RepID=A0A4U8YRF8_9BACT|nr:prepilin-type N-terminal cleavage/methylation domain-containing protein [Desulfoluna butyratoxydans]VFQ45899.1 prokaryotic n-terminal methylation site [Desulfoluna butyratoxydans]